MKDKQQKDLEKFWKWCGFQRISGTNFYLAPDGKQYYNYEWHSTTPTLDLNNIFKYAEPVLESEDYGYDISWGGHKQYRATIVGYYLEMPKYFAVGDSIALAFFEATRPLWDKE